MAHCRTRAEEQHAGLRVYGRDLGSGTSGARKLTRRLELFLGGTIAALGSISGAILPFRVNDDYSEIVRESIGGIWVQLDRIEARKRLGLWLLSHTG